MKKYFVVSDTHSFYSEMITALTDKGFDAENPEHIVIICGDAFDRGHESVEMFEWMIQMNDKKRLVYVRGNHEDLLESCVFDIRKRRGIGRHHISNGTVRTIAHIVGVTDYDIMCTTFDWNQFDTKIDELLQFINSYSVDYFELPNVVFVHGWVPTEPNPINDEEMVHENWRDGGWKDARWENGMEMFLFEICPPDVKTVVCGHWHTSYGWSRNDRKCPEWGPLAIFKPYVRTTEDGASQIVAIDGCTAYTNKVNCVVFNEDGTLESYDKVNDENKD